jgi:hypothetical protein
MSNLKNLEIKIEQAEIEFNELLEMARNTLNNLEIGQPNESEFKRPALLDYLLRLTRRIECKNEEINELQKQLNEVK